MKKNTVYDCSIIELQKNNQIMDGSIIIENNCEIPFSVKRCYYLYDVPCNESRGGHAHKNLTQLIIAVRGSFDVWLDDGMQKCLFSLNSPEQGLFVVPGIWRDLTNFSSAAVCLVLASDIYKADDYIRDYSEFLEYKNVYNRTL